MLTISPSRSVRLRSHNGTMRPPTSKLFVPAHDKRWDWAPPGLSPASQRFDRRRVAIIQASDRLSGEMLSMI